MSTAFKSKIFWAIVCIFAVAITLRHTPNRSLEHRPAAATLAIPLAELPKTIGDYTFVQEIELHESVERKLHADEQITWVYQDERRPKNTPGSAIRLHAAFYSGYEQTLRVRHVPEVCYVNFGHKAVDSHRGTITIDDQLSIPLQIFRFSPEESDETYATAYCFIANGRYCAAPDEVRIACSNPDNPTAYFIKLEFLPGIVTQDNDGKSTFAPSPSDTQQILEQSQDFLSATLPHLQKCLP